MNTGDTREGRHSRKVCVAVPVYRAHLSPAEVLSLSQLKKVLGHHSLMIVAPDHLDVGEASALLQTADVMRFDPFYFQGTYHYTWLLLTVDFYRRFAGWEYLLVHQTDAYLFRDELDRWLSMDASYIGGPWRLPSNDGRTLLRAGNGGLSLRRLDHMIEVLSNARRLAMKKALPAIPFRAPGGLGTALLKLQLLFTRTNRYRWRDLPFLSRWSSQEDVFFSFAGPVLCDRFMIPEGATAARFSFDTHPKWLFENVCNRELPFGCHAWERNDPTFWSAFIDTNGHAMGSPPAASQEFQCTTLQ